MDESRAHVLLLIKQKGPSFLLGKDNFPGGKLEAGESPASAAIREVFEETNVRIATDAIALLKSKTVDGNTLHTFVATVSLIELRNAKTMETEPVRVATIKHALAHWALHPESAAPDVPMLVQSALNTLDCEPPHISAQPQGSTKETCGFSGT